MRSVANSVRSNYANVRVKFARPEYGHRWEPPKEVDGLKPGHEAAWQSHGGPDRGHPHRSLPYSFEAELPSIGGRLRRVALLGVFALHGGREHEAHGTLGATLQLLDGEEIAFRQDLLNGIHYSEASDLEPVDRAAGDGTSRTTICTTTIGGEHYRVDLLTVDILADRTPNLIRFKDLGSAASFVVFDVFAQFDAVRGCPFRSRSGGISLRDLGAAVRVGDRVKFGMALSQLERGMRSSVVLDEARGQALTFLAVVSAALIDVGGSKELHLSQLRAARELEKAETHEVAISTIRTEVQQLVPNMFVVAEGQIGRIVDESLALVERNFARSLTDASVAAQLGLSTSHFRYLFRKATGQPFHKYLVAVRLEKAQTILRTEDLPVSQVAAAVGFSGLAHFSRAFSNRFAVCPSSVRRSVR